MQNTTDRASGRHRGCQPHPRIVPIGAQVGWPSARPNPSGIINGADAGEHLAADLPGLVASTPRIGHLSTRKSPADGIYDLAAHRAIPRLGRSTYFAVASDRLASSSRSAAWQLTVSGQRTP